jgi:flagellar hook-associated protein 2
MTTVSSTTTSSATSSTSASYATYTSGFNATELAEIAYEDRLSKTDSLSTKITANQSKISAYESLQTLLEAVQSPLDALRNSVMATGSSSDAFLSRSIALASSDSTTANSYLGASVEYGTTLGSHDIVVTQVAKAERLGSVSEVASSSSAMSLSGTFTLGTSSAEDGSGATTAVISISSDMTLADIVGAINVSQSSTGVVASLVQTSDSKYMLVLTGASTDRSLSLTAGTGTDVLQSLGITSDASGTKADVLQSAQAAKLTIDGVDVTRSTNTITDAIDGVTLSLYKPSVTTAYSTTTTSGSTVTSASVSSTTLTLDIANDTSTVESDIKTFVSAYNSLRDFVLTNQSLSSDGTTASDSAVLFGDSILRSVTSTVQSILSSEVNGVSLGSIGISFDSSNYLELDTETLETALDNSFSSVQALFSYQMTSSSGNLQLLKHNDTLNSADLTFNITVNSSGTLSGVTVNGDSSLFTISGSTIKGATGTIYEGMSFVFVGKTSQSITVKLNAGIAERLYSSIDEFSDSTSGQIANAVSSLESQDSDLSSRISAIQSDAEAYREFLLTKYSNIAAKLATAQTTLALLAALTKSSS